MKPILFNTEMVRAILDGRKTVTRRVIKPHYRDDEYGFQVITTMSGEFIRVEKVDENECGIFPDGTERYVHSPYNPGDILWVRETWCEVPYEHEHIKIDGGYLTIPKIAYKADSAIDYTGIWRPSIHMPREAARLFLQVTDVRVERLQEITEEQAESEGVTARHERSCDGTSARIAFAELWDSTLPKNPNKFKCPENSWGANPWVWVIEFERCEQQGEVRE